MHTFSFVWPLTQLGSELSEPNKDEDDVDAMMMKMMIESNRNESIRFDSKRMEWNGS